MPSFLRAPCSLAALLMLASCSSESSSEADNQADATSDAVADVTTDVTDASAEETADTVEDTAPAEEFVESRLYRYLEGQFDSRDQSLVDFDYFEISLEVCAAVVPELGEYVLYVEQAVGTADARPYRQRVYSVEYVSGDVAETTVYALSPNIEEGAIDACDADEPPAFSMDELEIREGCGVVMTWDGERFEGGTVNEGCVSTLDGARYATSEVTVTETQMNSWDRGFDVNGNQVWGAVSGPYEFVRRSEVLPEPTDAQ